MNDRENRNQRQQQQRRNTGAGSRQQEQATAGGAMRDEDTEDFSQMEQQGGTYRPAGDRGLDFENDQSGDFDMDNQPSQQAGTARQQEGFGRGRQQEQSEPDRRRQAEQQGGMTRQPGERGHDENR